MWPNPATRFKCAKFFEWLRKPSLFPLKPYVVFNYKSLSRLAVFVVLFFTNSAFAAGGHSPLVITIDSFSFPPILHESESGEFSGTMGETVKMLCETGGVSCVFEIVPLKRAYKRVERGEVDAFVTIDIQQLNACCTPSDWSSPWTAGFFSSKGRDSIPKEPNELRGKELIVVGGMKSPYLFAKDLDQMAEDELIGLHKSRDIISAVHMFLKGRAPLLWGGEDFKWYIDKLDPEAEYDFVPVIEIPVVVWVRKDRPEILKMFNEAFAKVKQQKLLDDNNLLSPALMGQRYQDAVLSQ